MSQLSEQTLFLENEIAKIHDTLPHLPLQWREFLRNIIPWLTLIGGIMGSIGLLSMARMYTSPFGQLIGMYGQISTLLIVNTLIMIVSTALYFIAFPKLKNQEKGGWNMIFWASLISII
jgi:hypothetical protein